MSYVHAGADVFEMRASIFKTDRKFTCQIFAALCMQQIECSGLCVNRKCMLPQRIRTRLKWQYTGASAIRRRIDYIERNISKYLVTNRHGSQIIVSFIRPTRNARFSGAEVGIRDGIGCLPVSEFELGFVAQRREGWQVRFLGSGLR